MSGIGKIQTLQTNPTSPPGVGSDRIGAGPQFEEALKSQLASMPTGVAAEKAKAALQSQVKFSNHAVDRMRSRGIAFSPTDLQKIEGALQKAQGKGAKDTLVLMDQAALILNTKTGTVVTVMDRQSLKENVFTNIDSTIVM